MTPKKSFTLIETLVVLAVIVLLAAVTIPTINQSRAKARDARRIKELKQIETALRLYSQSHDGNFPACDNGEIISTTSTCALASVLVPRYLIAPPEDPLPNSYGYYYKTASVTTTQGVVINGAFFKLAAYMETNKEAAENDSGTASSYYEIFSASGNKISLSNQTLNSLMPGYIPPPP